MEITRLTDLAIKASVLAGIKILEVYSGGDFDVRMKEDQTPVTKADWNAHLEIMHSLQSSEIPVLSEEASSIPYQDRKNWKMFWLVDPLDGTKEFIKRNDEFTVNIALMIDNQPVSGVIYAPVTGELYVGIPTIGAWKLMYPDTACSLEIIRQNGEILPIKNHRKEFVIAASRSHQNAETVKYIDEVRRKYPIVKIVNRGSSLKTCMVAEGSADVYPRFGKTMEWDTAAGHALMKAVGKNIFQTDLKTELTYNKNDLLNPHFIVI